MAKDYSLQRLSTLALRTRKQGVLRNLRLPPQLIRASVVERFTRCGKPNCRCLRGRKHGPFYYLTQCLGVGQMRKFLLKTPEAQQQARQAVQAYRPILETLDQLSWINLELLRRDEPWSGEPPPG